jgi:hypothetical protein
MIIQLRKELEESKVSFNCIEDFCFLVLLIEINKSKYSEINRLMIVLLSTKE